jgi:hypothetical protein
MAEESELHNLELRIAKLEDQLRQERAARRTPDFSDDDLRSFLTGRQAFLYACGKLCAPVEINIYACHDQGPSYERFLRLTGHHPGQEISSESAETDE